jgi:hypothetical protein
MKSMKWNLLGIHYNRMRYAPGWPWAMIRARRLGIWCTQTLAKLQFVKVRDPSIINRFRCADATTLGCDSFTVVQL